MRYAQAEKAKLDSDKRCEILTTKNNDFLKEKENLQIKLSEFKLMNTKLQQAYENKLSELTTMKKEFEKLKELNQSIDATLKSTLNHLKGESFHLKEHKELNERLKKDLNEQHEINEQLKEQCKQLTEGKIQNPGPGPVTQSEGRLGGSISLAELYGLIIDMSGTSLFRSRSRPGPGRKKIFGPGPGPVRIGTTLLISSRSPKRLN